MKKVVLYALSTCAWCRRTERFLKNHRIEATIHYVDLLKGDEKQAMLDEISAFAPRRSFPIVVVDDREVVIGYREERLREVLGL